MSERSILLRYHEVALKGDNRGWFEDRLAINARKMVQQALGKGTPLEVRKHHGRIEIEAEWNALTQEALSRTFGLSSYSPMLKVKTDREIIQQIAIEEFERYISQHGFPKTFRVRTRRTDKVFPETSMELDRIFGSAIKEKFPTLEVDLKNAEMTLGIELRKNESFIWTEKIAAQGGLPVGSNARVLTLISGGLDSPVAAIQVLRRGSPSSFIHFYGAPFVGEEVLEKIEDLVRLINRYQPEPQPLHLIPFGKIQEKIALATNPKMRTLLYRRMMIRIANEVAKKVGAEALVTGESLGQVASQTVENLSSINSVAKIPILRPLIAFDKDEIIERAKKWGSFEVSIRPGLDCCTLFGDRHPTLRSTPSLLEEQEAKFSVQELTEEALSGLQIHRVSTKFI
jgi:thiamine biosynthesis protein ThiI